MNNEQRYQAIYRLLDESAKLKTVDNKDCSKCRYARNGEYHFVSECRNPVAYLIKKKYRDKNFPTLEEMRSKKGYCGPHALIFENRRFLDNILFWRQPTQIRSSYVFMITLVLCLISTIIIILSL